MATRLEDAVLTDALTALSAWRGDTSAIVRSVELTDEQNETVVGAVMVTADAMNHHPEVSRTGGSTSFTLSTHSEGGVTELDIMLASRIDDLLRHATPKPAVPADAGAGAGAGDPAAAAAPAPADAVSPTDAGEANPTDCEVSPATDAAAGRSDAEQTGTTGN